MRLYIICLVVNFIACHKKVGRDPDETKEKTSEEEAEISDDQIQLNLKGNIRKLFVVELGLNYQEQKNMICSPISAMIPLAKLLLGAKKESKSEEELLAAIGLENREELNITYSRIIEELQFLEGVKISLASRIYLSNKFKLQYSFKKKSISIFNSTVQLVDTNNAEEVANTVNSWVAEHTDNKIQDIITKDQIDKSAALIVVNAIYFKGSWREPFQRAVPNTFHSPNGNIKVPMMSKHGHFNYTKNDELNAQIIELPYKGGQAAMIIVLPYNMNGLPILLRTIQLSHSILEKALKEMVTVSMKVIIPKFKIETTLDLKNYYQKLEVSNSLDFHKSGLSKIVKNQTVFISSAIQKAFIEVTEEGTEAGAASVVQILEKQLNREEFNAKWPFLFYVRSLTEQLFAGVVVQP